MDPNLNSLVRLFRSHIIASSDRQVVLVLSTVHAFVNRFARQTVAFVAYRTRKEVGLIFVDAPASAVWRLAVVAVLSDAFCTSQAPLQKLHVNFWRHNLNSTEEVSRRSK